MHVYYELTQKNVRTLVKYVEQDVKDKLNTQRKIDGHLRFEFVGLFSFKQFIKFPCSFL